MNNIEKELEEEILTPRWQTILTLTAITLGVGVLLVEKFVV